KACCVNRPAEDFGNQPNVPPRWRPWSDYARRSRRLSSITRAPCRSVMGTPGQRLQGGVIGGDCNVIVLNARDVLDDAVAVGLRPYIDAVGEMRPRLLCLLHRHRPLSSIQISRGSLL